VEINASQVQLWTFSPTEARPARHSNRLRTHGMLLIQVHHPVAHQWENQIYETEGRPHSPAKGFTRRRLSTRLRKNIATYKPARWAGFYDARRGEVPYPMMGHEKTLPFFRQYWSRPVRQDDAPPVRRAVTRTTAVRKTNRPAIAGTMHEFKFLCSVCCSNETSYCRRIIVGRRSPAGRTYSLVQVPAAPATDNASQRREW